MTPLPTTTAITHFATRHPYWDRLFALDVLRETRRASRDLAQFMAITGLTHADASALWVSGRDARQEIAA